MSDSRIKIQALLDQALPLAEMGNVQPHNYMSVVQCMMQTELLQEIETLQHLLNTPESFTDAFLKRCKERVSDRDHTIPFDAVADSPANMLYWQIAEVLFAPVNMHEMMAVILPTISTRLVPQFPESYPLSVTRMNVGEFKEYMRKHQPHTGEVSAVVKKPLFLPDVKPSIETLAHYVMAGDAMFDVRDMTTFNLLHHASLEIHLRDYAEIHEKLYRHNDALQALKSDIHVMRHEQVTPRNAMTLLIKALRLGSSHMTNNIFASEAAMTAAGRFAEYFYALSAEPQHALRALTGGSHTLGRILDNEIAAGQCVASTAISLTAILDSNKAPHHVLDEPPGMTAQALARLQMKYALAYKRKNGELDTRKDNSLNRHFPSVLTASVMRRITANNTEELINLLMDFPPTFYDNFWQHVTLRKPDELMRQLANLIRSGFFNATQLEALAESLLKYFARFKLKKSLLDWAKLADNFIIFKIIMLKDLPEERRITILMPLVSLKENSLLLSNSPEILQFGIDLLGRALENIPVNKRLAILTASDLNTASPLQMMRHASVVKVMLSSLILPERMLAVMVTNSIEMPLLVKFREDTQAIKMVLELLREQDRLLVLLQFHETVVLTKNHTYYSESSVKGLAERVIKYNEIVEAVSPLLPVHQRQEAALVNKLNADILYFALPYRVPLVMMIGMVPVEERLGVICAHRKGGDRTLLQYCFNYLRSLRPLLESLSSTERFKLFNSPQTWRDIFIFSDSSRLHYVVEIILELFTLEENITIVSHILKSLALNHLKLAQDIIYYVPAESVPGVIQQMLFHAAERAENLGFILSLLPEDQRLASMCVCWKDLPRPALLIAAKKSETLLAVLESLPQAQRLDAIINVSIKGLTILGDMQLSESSDSCSSNASKFIAMLRPLTESQRLALLTTTIDHLPLLHYVAKSFYIRSKSHCDPSFLKLINDTFTVDKLQSSCVPYLINVYQFLFGASIEERTREGWLYRTFFQNEAAKLLTEIIKFKTFDDFKIIMINYLRRPKASYKANLLTILIPDSCPSMEARMTLLEERWGVVHSFSVVL